MGESVVTGLRPWAVYQLRVFAENQLGKSKEGKVLQVGFPQYFHTTWGPPFSPVLYLKPLIVESI